MRITKYILFSSMAGLTMLAGCASAPPQSFQGCSNCGEVEKVLEPETTANSLSNDDLDLSGLTAASAVANFNSLGQGGSATRQSALTSRPGMLLRRSGTDMGLNSDKNYYEVLVRMSSGERRVFRQSHSVSERWQEGDQVKVVGNSLVRN